MSVYLIAEQILGGGRKELGICSKLDFLIIEVDRTEVFGQAFIEPSLRRRIVVVQKHESKIVGDGAPRGGLKKVEDNEILIVAEDEKTGGIDGLALAQGRELVIRLVALESENGEWNRLVQFLLAQQHAKNGAHLLEA